MLTTYGVREVAKWLGVTRPAVANWRIRYKRWPVEPVVEVISGKRVYYGWTWEQKKEWQRWFDSGEDYYRRRTEMDTDTESCPNPEHSYLIQLQGCCDTCGVTEGDTT